MIRAVLDVNVLVSAVLGPLGFSRQIAASWERGRFAAITAEGIIGQVEAKLSLARIRKRFNVESPDDIARVLRLLRTEAELVVVPLDARAEVTGDPKDDYVLATGRLARAGYLVTGDHGLLALGRYAGMAILSPRDFVEILRAEETSP